MDTFSYHLVNKPSTEIYGNFEVINYAILKSIPMAYKNKTIQNPMTGQVIKFLQTNKDTNGQLLEMESTWLPESKEPPAHYHPYQDELFTVITGEITIRLDGEETHTLQAGDFMKIPRNQVHCMWNASSHKTIVNWQVRPALNTELLLETLCGLASDGKTNKRGKPGMLQVALIASKFSRELRLVKPAYGIQQAVFSVLRPFALIAGYKAVYDKYLN